MHLPLPSEPQPRRTFEEGLTAPWQTKRNELIAAVIGSVIPWIAVGVCVLCGVKFGGDLAYIGALCMIGLQIASFRFYRLPRKNRTVFFGTFAMALLYIGILAAAIGADLSIWWILPLPPVAVGLYVGLRILLLRIIDPAAQG